MALGMFQASVPVFQRMLGNLDFVLEKGEASALARNFDPQVLLRARLAPDMFDLTRQVQIATDHAKGAPARLAGVEPPAYEDKESTFAELKARIQKTQAYLATFEAAQIDGSETRVVRLKAGPRELEFKGADYLLGFALPNFYFHYTTAYAILRHNGVDIGKREFLTGRGGF
jgi:hypothetical protein